MSALIQAFSSLSLSSRTLRGDAKVASPSTRALPKNRTAVVTEAVRFVAFFFCSFPIFFCIWAVVVVFLLLPRSRERRGAKEKTETVSRDFSLFLLRERDSFAFDSVARRRLCSSRDLQVVASLVARAEAFFVFRPHKKFYPRERQQKSLFRFSAAKKTSLSLFLCVCYKKYTDSFSLSFLPSFLLEFTEKEMGKASVKPKRQTVASEDARENERQGHRHRRRG